MYTTALYALTPQSRYKRDMRTFITLPLKDLVPVKILRYNVREEGLEYNMQESYFDYLKK